MGVLEIIFDSVCDLLTLVFNWIGSFGLDPFPGLFDRLYGYFYSNSIAAQIIYDFIPINAMGLIVATWLVVFPMCLGVNIALNWLKAKFN